MRKLPPEIAAAMPWPRRDITVEGVRLSVVDAGPRDAAPLVLLHGNPTWSYLYRKLVGPLVAAGHRVVVLDHAGFGLSEKPTDPRYYSLERHAENLRAVLAALDVRDATLVLHDWGGPIGMTWATREPQRVKRILVCNTVAFAPKRKRAFTRWHALFASPLGYQLGVRLDLVRATAMRGGVRRPLSREARRAYAWPMREKGGRVAAARFVQMVPDGPDHPEAATLREAEARFPLLSHAPVHVLWADRDPVMPPRLAERWRESGLAVESVEHVAPDAGHFWQEDAPEAFLRRIQDILSSHDP
ncbi:MAG: haloalkane dehalogenase [Thermoplasmata archaeon]|jgi:haloalkane dehalogenase|nr:haloalkane dehalogenase [Thermoplasmata archaeon]